MMRGLALVVASLVIAVIALWPAPARAHAMRSVLVEIDELQPGHAALHLRTSVPDAARALDVEIPGCSLTLEADRSSGVATCEDGALAGRDVSVRGLGPVLGEAVVWIRYADATTASHVLTRDEPSWTLPVRASTLGVARQYVRLGVVHILGGSDHLLFLFLLVLTLKEVRAVLLAETAFTLSHSISFTATALGWIRVSPLAAEACIALSLVLVALDVERPRRNRATPSRIGAAALAFLFGLVHGLGFAGGLSEIGLPERDVAAALVSFGAGVEIGQVAFLAVVLTAVHFARRLPSWRRIALAGAYASGAVSTSWLIERALACASGG